MRETLAEHKAWSARNGWECFRTNRLAGKHSRLQNVIERSVNLCGKQRSSRRTQAGYRQQPLLTTEQNQQVRSLADSSARDGHD